MCSAATILTAQKRSIRLTIAGNPLPIVITANEARQIEARHKTEPLGLGEKPLYESFEYELAQNEMLLIATNGLFKAFEQIANMPLLDFLNNEKFVDNSDCRDKIIARLGATSAAGFSDDITFLIAG
jgi:serine phosphatase RsbU (regulator of sigma subunit)